MRKPPSRVTISDVARSARVAVGTVSRVLNNFSDVSPDVRAQVLAAAEQLSYTRLRRRRQPGAPRAASNYGMICFGMEDTLVHLPVVSSAIQGIGEAIGASGGTMMLDTVPHGDRAPSFLQDQRVAGVILKGPNQGELPSPSQCELLRQIYRLPHVWLMGRLPNAIGDHCNFDKDEAGRLIVEHLSARGHRRIVFLNPKPGHVQFELLKRGVRYFGDSRGLEIQLLECEPATGLKWPLPAITSEENVDQLVRRWAAQAAPHRPTAIVVPSDRTAVQAYSSLHRLGVRPGKDVGIISCNNEQSVISGLSPALTTLDVHAEEIGRRAIELLRWRIERGDGDLPVQLLVPPHLVERDSVPAL